MASNPQFNWRDYITIDRRFPVAEREVIARAFDDIARFHDNEGQALIRQAAQVSGGRLRIVPSHEGSAYWRGRRIGLDMGEASVSRWLGNGTAMPGLVPVLVHELYHAADSTRDINEQARRTLLRLLRVDENDPEAARLRGLIRTTRSSRNVAHDAAVISEVMLQQGALEAMLRHHDLPELADRARELDGPTKIGALVRAGVIYVDDTHLARDGHSRGHLRHELDATRFTDALMARNYGSAFPQRRVYGAMELIGARPSLVGMSAEQVAQMIHYAPLPGVDHATPGFAAEPYAVGNLGQLPPPTVRAHTPARHGAPVVAGRGSE